MSSSAVRDCLAFDERPATPPHVRKYRRSTYLEPGQRFQHYGIVEDLTKLDLGNKVYGVTSDSGNGTASELLSHKKLTELEKINQIKAEKVYKGVAREPLGHSMNRGTVLPSKFTEGEQRFGIASKSSEEPAKDIIFPNSSMVSIKDEEIYKKSHGSYNPGEQKKRDYNWPINPTSTVFGMKGQSNAFNGVSKNIEIVLKGDTTQSTLVNSKRVEEFRNTADVLGQSRNLGQGSSARPFDMVYGKPSASNRKSKSQLSAAEIIRGRYNYEEQKPDRDLGKSITPGFRNISLEERAFGVPSIRTDLPAKSYTTRSIADGQNYGDDVPAQDLINPPAFSDLSISPHAMNDPRPKDRILVTFQRIGYDFPAYITDLLFEIASRGFSEGFASINSYRDVLNEYIEAMESGHEQEWIEFYTSQSRLNTAL